jgi:hypothetical protein
VCAFWCAGVGVGVLSRTYSFSLILFYTTVIHVCVFVDVRAVMHVSLLLYGVCVCVCCVVVLVRAHRVSMILIYNKVIHVCLHVCGRAVFHYSLVQGVCV